jgi:hypothetical protein
MGDKQKKPGSLLGTLVQSKLFPAIERHVLEGGSTGQGMHFNKETGFSQDERGKKKAPGAAY